VTERSGAFGHHLRSAFKSPIVIFALAFLAIVLVGAPLFAILEPGAWRG
jgi:uncharacterized membrane protein